MCFLSVNFFAHLYSQMLQLKGFFPYKALWQMLQLGLLSFKSSVENVTIKWLFLLKALTQALQSKGFFPLSALSM